MNKNGHMPIEITEQGTIIDIKNNVVSVDGIKNCVYGELLHFESGDKGLVIEFDSEKITALLIGTGIETKAGDKAISKGELLQIPVSEKLIGRIVNSLVKPLDGKGQVECKDFNMVFNEAPTVMSRVPISESLNTGIKVIDTIIPVGKGQRELIIGDRQTGKTTLAVDAIINQKDKDVICIYCWIGGSFTSMVKVIELLSSHGALDYTTFVAAPASVSATEQYLAPYAAAAIGEYFMKQKKDVLLVLDNLTKHAWIYRQISLLLNRSPGREAYPGDIFYIHSQLLERAGRLNPEIGGSMTCLPIVDTLQGDVTGYIQTNLVSMTDGQIYTSSALFNEGIKPAIDIGLSVSRIGSKVQSSAIKEISGILRLEYAQFREFQKLTKLRAKISEDIARKINRGQTLTEILIQPANSPISTVEMILIFYAFKNNLLDEMTSEQIGVFEANILEYMEKNYSEVLNELIETQHLSDNVKEGLKNAYESFLKEKQ